MTELLAIVDAGDCGKELGNETGVEKRVENRRERLLGEVVKITSWGKEIGDGGVWGPRGGSEGLGIETCKFLEHGFDKATHRKKGETIAEGEEERSSE